MVGLSPEAIVHFLKPLTGVSSPGGDHAVPDGRVHSAMMLKMKK
jgi:hypothetical protein